MPLTPSADSGADVHTSINRLQASTAPRHHPALSVAAQLPQPSHDLQRFPSPQVSSTICRGLSNSPVEPRPQWPNSRRFTLPPHCAVRRGIHRLLHTSLKNFQARLPCPPCCSRKSGPNRAVTYVGPSPCYVATPASLGIGTRGAATNRYCYTCSRVTGHHS